MGPCLQAKRLFGIKSEREREIERDRYAGQKKVALNKCSSFLTVNPKSKFKEPSLHWSNSLIKQPVDIDVYYDTKTKNRIQTKKYFVEMDPVTAYGIALLPSGQ